jgi:hypothetical protein
MSYRKVEQDGVTYEYTVGRTHVKIKGVGAFPKEQVGRTVNHNEYLHCECCGESMTTLYPNEPARDVIMVKPSDILATIPFDVHAANVKALKK